MNVKDIEGKTAPYDASKEVGNVIFQNTRDLGELELARDIYQKGEVDLTKEQAQIVKNYVEPNFKAWGKEAIIPALDVIINNKK
jgi:hypothetical protein